MIDHWSLIVVVTCSKINTLRGIAMIKIISKYEIDPCKTVASSALTRKSGLRDGRKLLGDMPSLSD